MWSSALGRPLGLPEGRGGGLFVVFEGGEGAGKSTQAIKLAAWLQVHDREAVLTREPGATAATAADGGGSAAGPRQDRGREVGRHDHIDRGWRVRPALRDPSDHRVHAVSPAGPARKAGPAGARSVPPPVARCR
ncbi:MAG: hypothetical protein GEU94_20190 [Micromonosporaceae bacterium]|nr:hypothetical protein [Micromonosporaceae bacterium]